MARSAMRSPSREAGPRKEAATTNETGIIQALEAIGATVEQTRPAAGLCWSVTAVMWMLLEVKGKTGKLTPDQQDLP